MTSDETQIQMIADWSASHAQRVTVNNRQRSGISCRCRDKKIAERQKLYMSYRKYVRGQYYVKNEQHIGSKKIYGPENTT